MSFDQLFEPTGTAPIYSVSGDLQYAIYGYQDILRIYQGWRGLPGWDICGRLRTFWNEASCYAQHICSQIAKEWSERPGDSTCYNRVVQTLGWTTYANKVIHMPFYIVAWKSQCNLQGTTRLTDLLCELENTAQAIDDLRTNSIIDHKFDPVSRNFLLHLEDSDTCNSDDDDDHIYVEMRKRLYAFQVEENQKYLRIEPVHNRTLRKDIRAWARLARYDCIKLPCHTMLIHKDKGKLPHRTGIKKQNFKGMPTRQENTFTPPIPPTNNYEKSLTWQRTDATRPPSRNRSMSNLSMPPPTILSKADIFEQRVAAAVDAANENSDEESSICDNLESVWQPRQSNAGYYSAESGDSSASMWSNASRTKKRRLPRTHAAYVCDSPGCGKSYNRQCDLTHHQRSHRPKDSLPFACELCEKRFGFAKDLRRHQKTHIPRAIF